MIWSNHYNRRVHNGTYLTSKLLGDMIVELKSHTVKIEVREYKGVYFICFQLGFEEKYYHYLSTRGFVQALENKKITHFDIPEDIIKAIKLDVFSKAI